MALKDPITGYGTDPWCGNILVLLDCNTGYGFSCLEVFSSKMLSEDPDSIKKWNI